MVEKLKKAIELMDQMTKVSIAEARVILVAMTEEEFLKEIHPLQEMTTENVAVEPEPLLTDEPRSEVKVKKLVKK